MKTIYKGLYFCFMTILLLSCAKEYFLSVDKIEREEISAVVSRSFEKNRPFTVKVIGPKILKTYSEELKNLSRKITDFSEYFLIELGYDVLTSDPIEVQNESSEYENDDFESKHHMILRFGPIEYDDKKELIFYFDKQRPITIRGERELEDTLEKLKNLEMEIGKDYCLFQVPSKKITMKVEVLSTRNNKIIGKANIVSSSKALFPKNYKASVLLGLKECQTFDESFDIEKYQKDALLYDEIKSQVYQIITKIFVKIRQNRSKYEESKKTVKEPALPEKPAQTTITKEPSIKEKEKEKEEIFQSDEEKKLLELLRNWQKEG